MTDLEAATLIVTAQLEDRLSKRPENDHYAFRPLGTSNTYSCPNTEASESGSSTDSDIMILDGNLLFRTAEELAEYLQQETAGTLTQQNVEDSAAYSVISSAYSVVHYRSSNSSVSGTVLSISATGTTLVSV